jgi:hypothetical protein
MDEHLFSSPVPFPAEGNRVEQGGAPSLQQGGGGGEFMGSSATETESDEEVFGVEGAGAGGAGGGAVAAPSDEQIAFTKEVKAFWTKQGKNLTIKKLGKAPINILLFHREVLQRSLPCLNV